MLADGIMIVSQSLILNYATTIASQPIPDILTVALETDDIASLFSCSPIATRQRNLYFTLFHSSLKRLLIHHRCFLACVFAHLLSIDHNEKAAIVDGDPLDDFAPGPL